MSRIVRQQAKVDALWAKLETMVPASIQVDPKTIDYMEKKFTRVLQTIFALIGGLIVALVYPGDQLGERIFVSAAGGLGGLFVVELLSLVPGYHCYLRRSLLSILHRAGKAPALSRDRVYELKRLIQARPEFKPPVARLCALCPDTILSYYEYFFLEQMDWQLSMLESLKRNPVPPLTKPLTCVTLEDFHGVLDNPDLSQEILRQVDIEHTKMQAKLLDETTVSSGSTQAPTRL